MQRRARHCLCFVTKHSLSTLLGLALLQVHSLALLDSYSHTHTHDHPNSAVRYFLQQLYTTQTHSLTHTHTATPSPTVDLALRGICIPASPTHSLFHPFLLTRSLTHSLSENRPIAPLAEVLGLDTFFTILSAILCERRIIFMATEVDTLSHGECSHVRVCMYACMHVCVCVCVCVFVSCVCMCVIHTLIELPRVCVCVCVW